MDPTSVEPLIPTSGNLTIGIANLSPMKIRITRQALIKSEEQDSVALVQAIESFHFIESDSAIGV